MRHFTSYGPVDLELHYGVPRHQLVAQCVAQLLGDPDKGGHYFTIWAARQTGKTWLMRQAVEQLRAHHGDRFQVGTLSMQALSLKPEDPPERFLQRVKVVFQRGMGLAIPPLRDWTDWGNLFRAEAGLFDRPLLLLIDEFDRLPPAVIDHLVSQLRDLYLTRQDTRLHGLALIGVRAVLGVESDRGSPFNVQRSLHVPNLSQEEVDEMFQQYQHESGQLVLPQVVRRVFEVTRGQPGLVGWFGELLTEKYNRGGGPITLKEWEYVYGAACSVEPNNTVLNLLKKARHERCRRHVVELFHTSNVPFRFDADWCNYLYLNGIIDYAEMTTPEGQLERVCRFSSPFVQLRLYSAFSADMAELHQRVPVVDPQDDLTEVFAALDLPALLGRYREFLRRSKSRGQNPWRGQPRRGDLHLREAVGHFHLHWWLVEASARAFAITPEFPTGNGKVDLHVRHRGKEGVIEVKSFTQRWELPSQREQAARYARSRGLAAATLALFVPVEDEAIADGLCREDAVQVDGAVVQVSTVAIAAA